MKKLLLIMLVCVGCNADRKPPVCYKWHLEYRHYSHLKLLTPKSDLQQVCDSPSYFLISDSLNP